MSRFPLLACLALAVAGCGKPTSTDGAGPASTAGTSLAAPPPQGGEVARPTATELAPLGVGQWTKYKVAIEDGSSLEITYKIVAEEAGGHWLEIVRGAADAGTVMQLLIKVKNRADPGSLELEAARIRMPNNQTRELRGEALKVSADAYRKMLADVFVPSLAGVPQEDVTVPAATFRGAYKRQQKVETAQATTDQNVWIHPAVPISGVVKSEEIGKPNKTELLTWGVSGAKSELSREKSSP